MKHPKILQFCHNQYKGREKESWQDTNSVLSFEDGTNLKILFEIYLPLPKVSNMGSQKAKNRWRWYCTVCYFSYSFEKKYLPILFDLLFVSFYSEMLYDISHTYLPFLLTHISVFKTKMYSQNLSCRFAVLLFSLLFGPNLQYN